MSAQSAGDLEPPGGAPDAPTGRAPAPALEAARAADDEALEVGLGLFVGFALIAIADAVAIALSVPLPRAGVGLRVGHHLFDLAETLGLGALAGAMLYAFVAYARLPRWAGLVVYAAVATPIQLVVLGGDLYRQASVVLDGRFEEAFFALFVVLTGLALPAAQLLGALAARNRVLRWIPVGVSVGGLIADHLFLRDDYFAGHGAIAWVAATFAGAALGPLVAPRARAMTTRPRGRILVAAVAIVAALGVVVPPPNAVRYELFRQPCAVAPWVFAEALWRLPSPRGGPEAAGIPTEWLASRAALPPTPPTDPRPVIRNPIVVLVTVDALRADAVNDPANDALLPIFTELKHTGAHFTFATSPGSQTAVSLSTTFSGRYFSELYWAMHGRGSRRFSYAADDPSPRYPALLGAAGVRTATICSLNFLAGEYGVTRGFAEERVIPAGRAHAFARQVIDPALEILKRAGDEPLFLYLHLMEPHSPYDRGRKDGTQWERYLSEAAVADAQIGRILRLLKLRFPDRATLVVSADHGEAFGEHHTYQHTKTLYEELLRVPLVVRGPGVIPARIDQHVGLIDVGPTILDLFGLETPSTFHGQSLAPLLWGRPRPLDRPLIAEGRLRRALYTPTGLKVIADTRRKIVEAYDLLEDPGETRNLFDVDPARVDPALAALQAFFDAHEIRRPGYRPIYKP